MSRDECRCDDLLARLFQMMDAELDAAEAERLRRHVVECPDCSRTAEAEEHMRALIRRSCAEHAPARLRARVITQITVMRSERFVIE